MSVAAEEEAKVVHALIVRVSLSLSSPVRAFAARSLLQLVIKGCIHRSRKRPPPKEMPRKSAKLRGAKPERRARRSLTRMSADLPLDLSKTRATRDLRISGPVEMP